MTYELVINDDERHEYHSLEYALTAWKRAVRKSSCASAFLNGYEDDGTAETIAVFDQPGLPLTPCGENQ